MRHRTPLRQNEQLLIKMKAHWIVLVKPIAFLLMHVALALFVARIIPDYTEPILASCVLSVLYVVYAFVSRERDIWIVTNQRVIDESGVFTSYSKETPLPRITNISYYQSFLGRMLGYGDVAVQTAALEGDTVYRKVTRPALLRDIVANACVNNVQSFSSDLI